MSSAISHNEEKREAPEEQFIKFPMLAFAQLRTLNASDLKVLLYIQRHTGNFSVARRILSIDEMIHGRKLKDGRRMDEGTGLSNRVVIDAVRKLETARLLFPADEEHGQKSYALVDCPPLTQLMKKVQRPKVKQGRIPVKKVHKAYEDDSQVPMKHAHKPYEESTWGRADESGQAESRRNPTDTLTEQFIDTQTDTFAASPRSPDGSPLLSEEDEEAQKEQPDLAALRVEYTTLSHQLAQLDVNKQAGQWARLYKQVQAAEDHLRQAEQESSPSSAEPSECAKQHPEYAKQQEAPETAKQQEAPSSHEGTAPPVAESTKTDERQERLRIIASELMYWREGLKVLRMAQLPKWRGFFKWQVEAKIAALQAAYATLREESAKPDG